MNDFRIGHGYDVHVLQEGLPMILGGVRIDHSKGFKAHSDGDVVAHALSDALLGALALGDLGMHFPDSDEKYRNADSMGLLKTVYDMVTERGYLIANVDITVILQAPKIRPYVDSIRESLARNLSLDVGKVSLKATTEEQLGFTGREEGAAVHAVVLLRHGRD